MTRKKSVENGTLWMTLRISFSLLIISIVSMFFSLYNMNISFYFFCFFLSGIALLTTFITSIMHLNRYKEKNFAIVTLVISSLMLIFGLFATIIGGVLYNEDLYSDDINELTCEYPESQYGDECCVVNTDYVIPLCMEETIKLSEQLNYAIENDILSEQKYVTMNNGFQIETPPDYFMASNIKAGILDMPMYLYTNGVHDDGNFSPMILMVIYSLDYYNENIYESYDSFIEGFYSDTNTKLYNEFSVNIDQTEPVFYENDDFDYALLNSTMSVDGYASKTGYAIIKKDEHMFMIIFEAQEPFFTQYYYEFKNMVFSLK